MKKILNIFASISLTTTGTSSIVACESNTKTNPTSEEIQQLYDKLNNQTFTIDKDSSFWGNEANYQQDLLTDLEQVADINSQQDKKLLSNDGVQSFSKPGEHTIDVCVGKGTKWEQYASVTIDWKLTSDQLPLYDFYKAWPEISRSIDPSYFPSIYKSPFIHLELGDTQKLLKNWWLGSTASATQGWDMQKVTKYSSLNLNGSILTTMLKNVIQKKAEELVGNDYANIIQKYLYVKPNIPMNLGKNHQLNPNDIMMQNDKASFPLNYVEQKINGVDQIKNWNISYSNNYYLIQGLLKQLKTPLSILQSFCQKNADGNYYARNKKNRNQILNNLENSGYSDIVDWLTFSGLLIPHKISQILVSYKGIYQGFKIPIIMG